MHERDSCFSVHQTWPFSLHWAGKRKFNLLRLVWCGCASNFSRSPTNFCWLWFQSLLILMVFFLFSLGQMCTIWRASYLRKCTELNMNFSQLVFFCYFEMITVDNDTNIYEIKHKYTSFLGSGSCTDNLSCDRKACKPVSFSLFVFPKEKLWHTNCQETANKQHQERQKNTPTLIDCSLWIHIQ